MPKEQNQTRATIELGLNLSILVFNCGYRRTVHHLYSAFSLPLTAAALASFTELTMTELSNAYLEPKVDRPRNGLSTGIAREHSRMHL